MTDVLTQDGELVDHQPLPAKIAEAVCVVMAAVPKLAKGEKNQHAKYNFASIDDFLEAVRPLCAEAGLVIIQDEDAFEVRGEWLWMTWIFTLAHKSGETWTHRPKRTIMVSSKMGAQAFGAAQSYALKQFMRALFQIATGEKGPDADEHPAGNLPERRKQQPKPPDMEEINRLQGEMDQEYANAVGPRETMSNKPHVIPLPPGPEDRAWPAWAKKMMLGVSVAETVNDLDQWVLLNDELLTRMQGFNDKWHAKLMKQIREVRDAFGAGEP